MVARVKVIFHLRSSAKLNLREIARRLEGLTPEAMATLLPVPAAPQVEGVPVLPPPRYPARMYELVSLGNGLWLMADANASLLTRRIAAEIYRNYAVTQDKGG